MSQELDEEMPQIASTSNNEITKNGGSESQSNAENVVENTLQPSVEPMDLQPVAENDTVLSSIENSNPPKRAAKRKLTEKPFCEVLLGEVNQSQQEAIDKISMADGLKEMKESLQNAESAQQSKHLCMLLAQCWKADVCIFHLAETGIGAIVRDLNRKYPDKDVKIAAREVLQKWRALVTEHEKKTTAEYLALKAAASASTQYVQTSSSTAASASVQASSSTAATSVSSNSQSSTSTTKADNKKGNAVTRPTTAKKYNSKFRSTGLEGNDEQEPSSKKPTSTFSSSAPVATPATFKKSLGNASVSNNFANALSYGSTVNVKELQKKSKKPPSIVDLLLKSPVKPAVTPSAFVPPAPVAPIVPEVDENGPDPTRFLGPDVPRDKRRIHFADDKGQELVLIQYIENVLLNERRLSSTDMKHADAEAERNSLKQLKSGAVVEEEDGENGEMKTDIQNNEDVESDDNTWKPIPYNVNEEISQQFENEEGEQENHLVIEENARCENVMRTFVADPDIPLEHPDEPDNVPNAYTQMRTPENIPLDYVLQKVTAEEESMEADAFISSAKELPSDDRAVPLCFLPTPPQSQVPAPNVTNIHLYGNVDVHGALYYNAPRPTAAPIPLNSIFFPCPPLMPPKKPPSQTIPPSVEEFVIMADETSQLNAPPSFSNARNVNNRSSGKICKFFLKGKCKFGNDCVKEHSQPQQQQPAMGSSGNDVPRFSLNNQENGSVRGGGRFNSSGLKKAPFSSPNQVPIGTRDQDNSRRSKKKRKDKKSRDLREDRRSNRSQSPPKRKRRRSPSYEDSPERSRRRRSQSPVSHSSSFDKKKGSRKRRRSPKSSRSSSRKHKRSRK